MKYFYQRNTGERQVLLASLRKFCRRGRLCSVKFVTESKQALRGKGTSNNHREKLPAFTAGYWIYV
ncbi:MAG TPA: hypothetical protein DCS07_05595 [Bdellovibrionales bacterium]|nr:MAG: hypothetical protein A2Z97_05820 [Bdellovibrionales bacterium GWB1_52_6]OFZ04392.1 MAG: hypothetical protein A2X97_07035 [Bdellovibrionales bacterium GWA1_52_35]HAR42093.1 hypothetical protein [Bdellovibrionales bacterium]HCM40752.1 hypothetical protein [Bdellovibrionales bacterium]